MAGEASDEEYEELAQKQRPKAALHYAVGRMCEETEGTTFSRGFVAAVSETTFKQCEVLATDLEQFARHAKRTTVSLEDVRLCCRRNSSLHDYITTQADQLRADRGEDEGRRRRGKKGHKEHTAAVQTASVEDSD